MDQQSPLSAVALFAGTPTCLDNHNLQAQARTLFVCLGISLLCGRAHDESHCYFADGCGHTDALCINIAVLQHVCPSHSHSTCILKLWQMLLSAITQVMVSKRCASGLLAVLCCAVLCCAPQYIKKRVVLNNGLAAHA